MAGLGTARCQSSWKVVLVGHCTALQWPWSHPHTALRSFNTSFLRHLSARAPFADTVVRNRPSTGADRAGRASAHKACPPCILFGPFECNQRSFPIPAASERELIVDNRHACSDHGCWGRWVVHSERTRDASSGDPPRHLSPRCDPSQLRPLQTMDHRSRRTPPGLISNSASRLRVHDLVFAALDIASSKLARTTRKLVSTAVLIPGTRLVWRISLHSVPSTLCSDDRLHHTQGNAGTSLMISHPCRKSHTPTNHQFGGRGPSQVTNTTCSCRVKQSLRVFRPDRRHVWPRMRPPVACSGTPYSDCLCREQ